METTMRRIIQSLTTDLSRFRLIFTDGEELLVDAFNAACAEHLAHADRAARGLDYQVESFRAELAKEEIASTLNRIPPPADSPNNRAVVRIPDFFRHAQVFGVMPVDDSSGELRTGVSFKLEDGEIIWLNLSCTDAEWLCLTLRSWMSDYEAARENKAAGERGK